MHPQTSSLERASRKGSEKGLGTSCEFRIITRKFPTFAQYNFELGKMQLRKSLKGRSLLRIHEIQEIPALKTFELRVEHLPQNHYKIGLAAEELFIVVLGALQSLADLHSIQRVHGDVRPEHIYYNRDTMRTLLFDHLEDSLSWIERQKINFTAEKALYVPPWVFEELCAAKSHVNINPLKFDQFCFGMALLHQLNAGAAQVYNRSTGKFLFEELAAVCRDTAKGLCGEDARLIEFIEKRLLVRTEKELLGAKECLSAFAELKATVFCQPQPSYLSRASERESTLRGKTNSAEDGPDSSSFHYLRDITPYDFSDPSGRPPSKKSWISAARELDAERISLSTIHPVKEEGLSRSICLSKINYSELGALNAFFYPGEEEEQMDHSLTEITNHCAKTELGKRLRSVNPATSTKKNNRARSLNARFSDVFNQSPDSLDNKNHIDPAQLITAVRQSYKDHSNTNRQSKKKKHNERDITVSGFPFSSAQNPQKNLASDSKTDHKVVSLRKSHFEPTQKANENFPPNEAARETVYIAEVDVLPLPCPPPSTEDVSNFFGERSELPSQKDTVEKNFFFNRIVTDPSFSLPPGHDDFFSKDVVEKVFSQPLKNFLPQSVSDPQNVYRGPHNCLSAFLAQTKSSTSQAKPPLPSLQLTNNDRVYFPRSMPVVDNGFFTRKPNELHQNNWFQQDLQVFSMTQTVSVPFPQSCLPSTAAGNCGATSPGENTINRVPLRVHTRPSIKKGESFFKTVLDEPNHTSRNAKRSTLPVYSFTHLASGNSLPFHSSSGSQETFREKPGLRGSTTPGPSPLPRTIMEKTKFFHARSSTPLNLYASCRSHPEAQTFSSFLPRRSPQGPSPK